MAKLKRKALLHYIKFGEKAWYLIGKSIDSMSVEMNGTFEQTKDITGEVSVNDDGYQPQISVEPYYADPTETAIYSDLKDLAMNRKSGDDAKAKYLEVWIDDDDDSTHTAWEEDCKIEISSYGGDTKGVSIAYKIWPDGGRQDGTVSYTGKAPTFTANSSLG